MLVAVGLGVVLVSAAVQIVCPNLGRNRHLALGEERIPDGEPAQIAQIVAGIERIIRGLYAAPGAPRPAKRDAHAKAHGCATGTVTVERDLPPELAVGLWAEPGRVYPAWVRLSNSNRTPQPDLVSDGRGLAVKLLGVPGEKLGPDEPTATTHDLVFINHPAFFVRDVADYVDFVAAEEADARTRFFVGLRPPWRWRLHEMRMAWAITHHPAVDPLDERYFSMTPYRLGERAVKVRAIPCDGATAAPLGRGDDALAETLRAHLAARAGCFLLQVQLQTDAHAMPVEDATIEWPESLSPFRTVARLELPAGQDPTTPARRERCEHLSFSPWHALPAHRPLGGINRVRRAAYRAISLLRHELNGVAAVEPTTLD